MNKRSNTSIQMIADYEGDVTNMLNVHVDGEIPILATRNMALFPGVIAPVIIGRKQSLSLLRKIRKTKIPHLPYSVRKTKKLNTLARTTFSAMAFMPNW